MAALAGAPVDGVPLDPSQVEAMLAGIVQGGALPYASDSAGDSAPSSDASDDDFPDLIPIEAHLAATAGGTSKEPAAAHQAVVAAAVAGRGEEGGWGRARRD